MIRPFITPDLQGMEAMQRAFCNGVHAGNMAFAFGLTLRDNAGQAPPWQLIILGGPKGAGKSSARAESDGPVWTPG